MKIKKILIISLIILISQCNGKNHLIPEFIDDPITRVDTNYLINKSQNIESYSNYQFLILLEKVIYRLEPKGKVIIQVHQITKVLSNEKGGLGKSFIYFRAGYEEVTRIEAYTLTRDMKRIDATEIFTATPFYNDFVRLDLYRDIKVKTISFPSVEKGSILNLRYQMEIDYPEMGGIVEGEFYLANRFPILKQKGVIIIPKGKKLKFKFIKTSVRPQKISTKDTDYYIIEQNNSHIITDEPFQPPFQNIIPKIIFSSLKNWSELNSKLFPIIDISSIKDQEVYELGKRLTAGINERDKKIEMLYNYVTNTVNIANAAIPFGIGGYVPHQPSHILKRKYADSLDKANLLAMLLKSVDINVKLAITNETYNIDPNIPVLKSFNRILVAVKSGKNYQFLDPHSAIVRYGYLPSNNYGKRVLILDSKKPVITNLPVISAKENQIIYNTQSRLNDNGDLIYTTKFIPRGSYEVSERANMIKIQFKNTFRSVKENYKSVYEHSHKIKLLKLTEGNPFDITKPYDYSVSFKITDFPIKKANMFLVQAELHHKKLFSFSRHRMYDLDFTLPFSVISKHKMKFPSKWKIEKLPKEIILSSPLWYYKKSFEVKGNTILYTRHLELKVSKVGVKDYAKFKSFIDSVIEADKKLIQFIPIQESNKEKKSL
ncbi:MAG: DUF3857 domain-containing protein [Spirochaetota bacterium]|nr:DUF3857 domain-containing protein [Spirochaetota bacterium]